MAAIDALLAMIEFVEMRDEIAADLLRARLEVRVR